MAALYYQSHISTFLIKIDQKTKMRRLFLTIISVHFLTDYQHGIACVIITVLRWKYSSRYRIQTAFEIPFYYIDLMR